MMQNANFLFLIQKFSLLLFSKCKYKKTSENCLLKQNNVKRGKL